MSHLTSHHRVELCQFTHFQQVEPVVLFNLVDSSLKPLIY